MEPVEARVHSRSLIFSPPPKNVFRWAITLRILMYMEVNELPRVARSESAGGVESPEGYLDR